MFDNIESTTKAVNNALKRLPTIFRWPIIGIVFIGLISGFLIINFITGMFKHRSDSDFFDDDYADKQRREDEDIAFWDSPTNHHHTKYLDEHIFFDD